MKMRMPKRWRKSKKAVTPISTPPKRVSSSPQKSRISERDQVRQAIENVRASQAQPGEVYGLTILEDNEYLVGWMNMTNCRLSSASTLRRNAMTEGPVEWRSAGVEVLEGCDLSDREESESRSATSASTMDTNISQSKKFGKSGIEIPGCGRIDTQGPRIQVHFRAIDWNPPPRSGLKYEHGTGPTGEIAGYEV